ncbi:DUF4411 family protein [uncultured Castellaniella sp.]|uniref:DUF4411 family protein n=1 Tax=uncultured Castellaniella sp. TaxID=647907 RepID=UPI00261309D7|nr:DUF4411 family protein [uncultured Castellaniella sp.]
MRYLLDSDVLIAAKSVHYKPGFCEAFWQWLDDSHAADVICSIDRVRDELLQGDGDDHLVQWARNKEPTGFFQETKGLMGKFGDVSNWAMSRLPPYRPAGLQKFLRANAADAWLVAYAASFSNEYTIVTNEVGAPEGRRDVKLPDAAAAFGVPTIRLFDLLDLAAYGTFNLRHP